MMFRVESCEFESRKCAQPPNAIPCEYPAAPAHYTHVRLVLALDDVMGDAETEMIANAVTRWRRDGILQVKL